MASTRRIVCLVGTAVAACLTISPGYASAAVTCTFVSGTGAMIVNISAGDTAAEVRNNSGTIEALNGSAVVQTCTPDTPTTANATSITMNDTVASQSSLFLLDLSSGALGPGTPAEGTGTSEIEVTVNASDGLADRLQVIGTASPDTYLFGAQSAAVGANLNNDDDSDDVTVNNGERLTVSGFGGDDRIDANGGTGFTGPVPYNNPGSSAVRFNGGNENDILTAGSGSAFLDGGAGGDTMTGGAGDDEIDLGSGNDTADGGGGSDFANFQFSPIGALIADLRITGPQDTGVAGIDTLSNFENLVGSQMAGGSDTLIGTNGPNRIIANAGDDTLLGLGGDDTLEGGPGTDTASYAQGSIGPITLSLGSVGAQATGGAGTDTLPDVNPSDGFSDVENTVGSPFGGDNLTGNAQANQIDVYDGLFDAADCVGPSNGNRAIADEIGVDSTSNCESVDNAPQTSISSGPAGGAPVATPTPTYGLTADEPSDFQYSVDSGPFVPCAAACTVSPLADGAHTLAFRAVDQDENGHADLTPATRTLTVDATAPDTSVSGRAKVKTRKKRVLVSWILGATEPGSSFQCSLDGGPFLPCTSPFSAKLRRGAHTLSARSTDALGNQDASPASFTTKVKRKR